MNKLRAKVKLISKEDSGHLIKAFFQEFYAENSILIKENEATIEISLEKIPAELIKAIYQCKIIELEYVGQKQYSDTAVDSIAIPNLDNKAKCEKTNKKQGRPQKGEVSEKAVSKEKKLAVENLKKGALEGENKADPKVDSIAIPNLDNKAECEKTNKKRGRPPKCEVSEKEVSKEKNSTVEKLKKLILEGDDKTANIGNRAIKAFGRIEAKVYEDKKGEDYQQAKEFEEISRVLYMAVMKRTFSWYIACTSAGIPSTKITELEMSLSAILNKFFKKNGEAINIKVQDFLKILMETLA